MIIKSGTFKSSRGWMIKLMRHHHFSYKKCNDKKIKAEDELCKKCHKFHAGLWHRIQKFMDSGITHQMPSTSEEHSHYSINMLLIVFPCQMFMGWNIYGLTMDGFQKMFHNYGMGYTSALPAFKFCI